MMAVCRKTTKLRHTTRSTYTENGRLICLMMRSASRKALHASMVADDTKVQMM